MIAETNNPLVDNRDMFPLMCLYVFEEENGGEGLPVLNTYHISRFFLELHRLLLEKHELEKQDKYPRRERDELVIDAYLTYLNENDFSDYSLTKGEMKKLLDMIEERVAEDTQWMTQPIYRYSLTRFKSLIGGD